MHAATRNEEEKLVSALQRLVAEDVTMRLEQNAETHQLVLWTMGPAHVDKLLTALRESWRVGVEVEPVRTSLRETFLRSTSVQGRLVKQSGGHGQYAVCQMEIEPLERGAGVEFAVRVVGGAVPRQFIPSVEKGIRNQMSKGVLAGYPMVDVRVTLVDGKAHSVDSSDMAFQTAAASGLREAANESTVALLEPIDAVDITVAEDSVGSVLADLRGRRGQVHGTETAPQPGYIVVHAEIPAHELSRYPIDLRSVSHGTGSFTRRFVRYDYLPTAAGPRAHLGLTLLSTHLRLVPAPVCAGQAMRSRTRGVGFGASSPIAYAPSSACRARGIRSGVSVCRLSKRLTGAYAVAGLGVQLDPGGRLDRLARPGPAGAEPPGGQADRHRVQGLQHTVGVRGDHLDLCGGRQCRIGIAVLSPDHRPPGIHRCTGGEHLGGVDVFAPGGGQHLPGQGHGQFHHVGRAAPGEHLDRLDDLESVAGGPAQRGRHVGEQGHGRQSGVTAQPDHGLGQPTGVLGVLHERPAAHLDVQHQRAGAFGDLLAHDRRGDQRDGLDRAGDVTQRVQLLVGRGQAGTGGTDDGADLLQLLQHLVGAERRPPTGDRLELVQGAAGVA